MGLRTHITNVYHVEVSMIGYLELMFWMSRFGLQLHVGTSIQSGVAGVSDIPDNPEAFPLV